MIWYLVDITARRERDTYSIKISDIISNIICTWTCGLCVCHVCEWMHVCETAYTASERCDDSSQRDIPLVMFPQTFLSPFHTPFVLLITVCASRTSLSRVCRSHECACIRIPAVQPLNLRPLSTSRFLKPRRWIRRVRGWSKYFRSARTACIRRVHIIAGT